MDERRYPGATEICDSEGVDEDCNTSTLGVDGDSDGYVSVVCCNRLATGRLDCGADCDDTSSGINPEAVDTCGSGDQDCDGVIDENPDTVFYRDLDGDGFGIDAMTTLACAASIGYAVLPGDCDDTRGGVNPGVGELCNLRDDDCDGGIDEGCSCTPDGLSEMCGATEVGSCRFGSRTCVAGTWSSCSGVITPAIELCEGVDDEDCDGVVDNGCECISGNSRICGTSVGVCRSVMQICSAAGRWPRDCADEVGVVGPTAEVCEGVLDEDCDGGIDEGCACVNGAVDRSACGTDAGECVSGMRVCAAGAWGTCSGGTGPVAEVCEGSRDENCDGATDEGCGCVNGTSQPCGVGACLSTRACTGGTWGACMGLSPSPEVCNGVDDDCDGLADSSDPDTQMVGASCGTAAGLCALGTNSCPGASLVCSGIAPTTETCDHRDQDCDGQLDDGVGVSTCTFSQTAIVASPALPDQFTCSWAAFCTRDSAGKIDGFTTTSPTSTAPRGATLRVSGGLPDWGERFLARGAFDLNSQLAGSLGTGVAGVFISPTYTPGSALATTQGLPTLALGQHGYAALFNVLFGRVELWEMTSTGPFRRATGSGLVAACDINSTTPRRITITLSSVGESITATATGTGCTTSTATYTDADWQSVVYGDSELLAYPRYQVGAHVWNSLYLTAVLQSFTATRTSTAARGNCVGCPW